MRSKIAKKILESTSEDELIFVSWYADIVIRIHELLESNGVSQKTLAERMGKTAPEISRWLSGEHNFTLKSLAKLQAELGGTILHIPHKTQFTNAYKSKSTHTVITGINKKRNSDYNEDYYVTEGRPSYSDKLPA